MKILAIETSCDETALSVVEANGDAKTPSFEVLGNALYSQAEKHAEYGGVFPSLAKREHSLNLVPLLDQLLKEVGGENIGGDNVSSENIGSDDATPLDEKVRKELAEIFSHERDLYEIFIKHLPTIARPDFDMIAVTVGPGLEPALWVGINFARALSLVWQIPVMPTNHMEGHIASVLLQGEEENGEGVDIKFPTVALLISGGHTEIVSITNWGQYEIIGRTRDDAVGEAFDKVARLLDLPYPGGPEISRIAAESREKFSTEEIAAAGISLPRPMIGTKDFDFSFSGLKTAALYLVKKMKEEETFDEDKKKMVAQEFEDAATEVLFKKTCGAIEKAGAKTLIIGGGVIANRHIREKFAKLRADGIDVLIPGKGLSTDNATMIGIAGFLKTFRESAQISPEMTANGNLSLE